MQKKNNNPERDAKEKEFHDMMQVMGWTLSQIWDISAEYPGYWDAVSKEDSQREVQEEGAEGGPEGEQEESGEAEGGNWKSMSW